MTQPLVAPAHSETVFTYYKTTFAPYGVPDPAHHILDIVNGAGTEILIDVYGFTYKPLMDALIAAHQRGISVRIVADHSQSAGTAERPQLQRLVDAGLEVLIGTSIRGGINHSKYVVADGHVVGFGSFNFSESALSQDNTFTETNDANMLPQFIANWRQVHDDAFGKHPEWQIVPSGGKAA